MYYDHDFYRYLIRAARVSVDDDVVVILNRDGEEERRVTYAEMTKPELAALCHYIGMAIRRLRESLL